MRIALTIIFGIAGIITMASFIVAHKEGGGWAVAGLGWGCAWLLALGYVWGV